MKAPEKDEAVANHPKSAQGAELNGKKGGALKINMQNEDEEAAKEYLSSIDNEVLTKLSCFSGLGTYLAKLKLKVNKFYFIYTILTIIHFSIYVNRGIIPGSYDFLSSYLKEKYATTNVDVHIGFLTSVFVFGLSISSIISGSLASTYSVFRITDVFLFQNSLALLMTGFSFIIGSYYSLMFSRFFCGFSEAAFITIIPPLIYSYSKDRAGSWISMFITMFPLGGCIGYLLAVLLPALKISIAQYFIGSGTVFMFFFLCFYLFDENLLKRYEDEKSRREQQSGGKPSEKPSEQPSEQPSKQPSKQPSEQPSKQPSKQPSEQPSETRAGNAGRDREEGKNLRKSVKGAVPSSVASHGAAHPGVPQKSANANNSANSTATAPRNRAPNKNASNSSSGRAAPGGQSRPAGGRRQSSNAQSGNAQSGSTQSSNTQSGGPQSSNTQSGGPQSGGPQSAKPQGAKPQSAEGGSGERKALEEGVEARKRGTNSSSGMYEEEMMHQAGEATSVNKTRSFNSTQKNYSDLNSNAYIGEIDLEANDDEEQQNISNNSYINNNLDRMYLTKSFGDDEVYMNTTQESYGKAKKENKYLEIELDNCIESMDEEKNNEHLNLGLLVNTTLTNISFLILVTALTAHTDMIQSYLVYGAPILYALKLFPSYKAATVFCSLCACLSSIVGTCLGGFLMDFYNLNIQNVDKNYEHIKNNEKKIKIYSKDVLMYQYLRIIGIQTFIILVIASSLVMLIPFITNTYLFTFVMTLGLTFLFSAMPGHNIGIMVCVPQNIRAFSIGMSSFISHLLGDIPWTIIIGKIKGTLSPDCVVTRNGELSERCFQQSRGLRVTLFIICSKSLIMAAASFLLSVHAKKKIRRYKNKQGQGTKA
ncbi:major facilitator superfamily-related transporter, putative [Plasmodium vivax]|uniref:Major facilitator superfamily-related transporter, putative n=1 Tax=Plasmodium vivax TaxID=5855 RepID=A0A564ZXI5_PLAVI|nr:major facilitator superfamily-related transporter, putative [Plasmodium vivax]